MTVVDPEGYRSIIIAYVFVDLFETLFYDTITGHSLFEMP